MYRDELVAKIAENDALRVRIAELEGKILHGEEKKASLVKKFGLKTKELIFHRISDGRRISTYSTLIIIIISLGLFALGGLSTAIEAEETDQFEKVCSNVTCGKDKEAILVKQSPGHYGCYCTTEQPKILSVIK